MVAKLSKETMVPIPQDAGLASTWKPDRGNMVGGEGPWVRGYPEDPEQESQVSMESREWQLMSAASDGTRDTGVLEEIWC